jgi:hypothetical protein
LDNLAVLDADDGDAADPSLLVRGRDAEVVAGVSHYGCPANYHFVICPKRVLKDDLHVWKRTMDAMEERLEIGRSANFDSRLILSNANCIVG